MIETSFFPKISKLKNMHTGKCRVPDKEHFSWPYDLHHGFINSELPYQNTRRNESPYFSIFIFTFSSSFFFLFLYFFLYGCFAPLNSNSLFFSFSRHEKVSTDWRAGPELLPQGSGPCRGQTQACQSCSRRDTKTGQP